MERPASKERSRTESPSSEGDAKAALSSVETTSSKKRKASSASSQSSDTKRPSKTRPDHNTTTVDAAPRDDPPDDESEDDPPSETSPENNEVEAAQSKDEPEAAQPPLPDEPTPPPLPDEEPPSQEPDDDGWQPVWDDTHQAFYFFNRFTQMAQWENPRVPSDAPSRPTNHERTPAGGAAAQDNVELHPAVVGGYNPAIHGSYDPNAAYAQYGARDPEDDDAAAAAAAAAALATGDADGYGAAAQFNRFTGRFQAPGVQPGNFSDESRARRQMNAFFDVDAAANSHNGRSLKAERAGKKLSKTEVKQFRERKRERKEEKKRAWLRD